MFSGEFAPSLFFKLATYIIIPTLFIIYYISQAEGHEPPFPHCWISGCAGHYPEFVFFRIATISGSVLVGLGWVTNYFYLKTVAREKVFRIEKYYPQACMVFGLMGAMLLMGSTANLDTGKSDGKWHTSCASTFFIFTLLAQVYNTVICWLVYNKVKGISQTNLYFKTVILGLLILQLVISSTLGEIGVFGENKALGNDIDKILEWTLTCTVIMGFYSIGIDTEKFEFVYENLPSYNPSLAGVEEVD